MLHALLLTPLESAINTLLQADPLTAKRLGAFTGSCIALHATDLQQSVFILPFEGGVQLQGHLEGEPDACLSGESTQFFALFKAQDKASLLFGNGIDIQGDHALANRFQALLADLQIDWEALLASVMGDLPAHTFAQLQRWKLATFNHTWESGRANLLEYVQEEAGIAPTVPEFEAFSADVRALRTQTDRLNARIDALAERLKKA